MHFMILKNIVLLLCLTLFTPSFSYAADNASDRPKIGLVLGGGGALGIAHVGVLRELEKQRIPIDYIAGTSMGSIIAGLYANGMSPDEIEGFLSGLDWNEVMTDDTPRRELYFRRKFEDERYLIELGLGKGGIKMSAGMAAGQKFNNLLQLQVQRSAHIHDFDELSIPYRAVATDLQSGHAYVLDHGNLSRAMRASMAVPGVFTPVELDGHLLVDGGIVNNLPVDVAESMGADIIIAVDVGAASDIVDPEKLKSLAGILGRTYAIAQRPGQLESLKRADIGIQPDLADFTASQFDRVKELIPQGEKATQGKAPELERLAVSEKEYDEFLASQRRPAPGPALVDRVTISGNERVSEKSIEERIYSKPGTTFNERAMQLDLMRIYGIGEFEQVLYHLKQDTNGTHTLNYDVTEKPWGPLYFALGFKMQTDFESDSEWDFLFNLTRRSLNDLDGEWRNDIEIGSDQRLLSEFYQPLDHSGSFFIAPILEYADSLQDVYNGKSHIAEYNVQQVEGRLDFGVQVSRFAELRVGPVWGDVKAEVETGSAGLPAFDEKYAGPAFGLIVDRQDRTLFAREGYYLSVQGQFPNEDFGGDNSFERLLGIFRFNHSIEDHTLLMGLQYGTSFGDLLPAYAQFPLGGPDKFAGLAQYQFRGSSLGVASFGYRYRLIQLSSQVGRGVYATLRYDVGNVWDRDIDIDDLRHGILGGIAADTSFGTLNLSYGRADGGYARWYFSMGTNF